MPLLVQDFDDLDELDDPGCGCDEPLARYIRSDRIKTSSKSSSVSFAVRLLIVLQHFQKPFLIGGCPSRYIPIINYYRSLVNTCREFFTTSV